MDRCMMAAGGIGPPFSLAHPVPLPPYPLIDRPPPPRPPPRRWAMPSNACTDVAVAGDLLVAAVCPGNGVHLLDAAPGSQGAFRPAPGVAACSLAFDSEGFLWLALYSVGGCGPEVVPKREAA